MKQITRLDNPSMSKAFRAKPLLNAAFIGLALSSVSVVTEAAEENHQNKPAFTISVVTHGEGTNRSDNLSEVKRQDNRRTDVSITKKVQAGTKTVNDVSSEVVQVKVSDAVKRSIRLNDGGVIWVSKDPASLTPVLNVTAPRSVEMEDGQFTSPMNFNISSNYASFIDSWELRVFNATDTLQKRPIALFTGDSLEVGHTVKWDGETKQGKKLQTGDKLTYVLTVKDAKGHIDRTHSRNISLTGPERNITKTGTDEHISSLENNLDLQTIPVHGSRVRIFGRDIPSGHSITINKEKINLVENKFVIEKLLPEGKHNFGVGITDNNNNTYTKNLNVDLQNKYLFMVALADITAGEGRVSGNLETLSDGDKYLDGDIFVDGRLAFYLKGKVKGKYLVTAQLDTGTEEIDELFDDIHKKDASSVFRRLDPDQYYPVYGDDSTLIDDTNSQGRAYVRVDWDKSQAIWGNYNTDITGTELSSFNRSLYGAKFDHRSTKTTSEGEHKTDLTLFASEAQSAFRHNEFKGTGGSLYYLRDTDIVDGSEKVWIEIRQSGGERVVEKIILEEGRDYQIDDFQGRIILNRPLLQIAAQSYPSIIKDDPLDGDDVFLIADYEYVPDDFDSDKASYGARGKAWLGNHFAVGGTYAHEDRLDTDYELRGLDFTLQKSKGTYIKAEYAESESQQTQGSFISIDGGLNFSEFSSNNAIADVSGDAYSLEARADLADFTSLSGSIGAWFKERDQNFSSNTIDTLSDTTDFGVEAVVDVNDRLTLAARIAQLEREILEEEREISAKVDFRVNDKLTLSGEIKHVEEKDLSANAGTANTTDGEGTLGAFKVGYNHNKNVNLYAIAQGTIDSSGAYENNDLLTLGIKAALSSKLDVLAEVSAGDRGESLTAGLDYRLSDSYSLYSNFTLSTDRTDNVQDAITFGQRKRINDQLSVFSEHQFTHQNRQTGIGRTFGIDYQVSKEIKATASAQSARLDKEDSGLTDRDAFSVGLSYKEDKIDASTRLEYRRDEGDNEETEQFVTTNNVNYRLNPSLRLQGRLNYSETKDNLGNTRDARFAEAGVGFAYRPINHDRLNVLGRLTYLYDLQPLAQSTGTDEKSLIASLEATYQVNQRWEVGGKLAHRSSEIRDARDAGDFSRNDATLASARVRYHLTNNWDATAQYHWLNSQESDDTQHGALISVDRHIGKNLKVGVGYNFTDFDDDLRNTDGSSEGWFVNLVGKF